MYKFKNGVLEIDLTANQLNDSWLRAARLKKKGDKKSLKELERMEKTKLKKYTGE
jgi:hypothetical protein